MKKVLGLSVNDLRNIRRDPMLLAVLFGPVLMTLVVRFGIPRMDALIVEHFQFHMLDYDMLILSFFMLIIPFLIGILVGLLILDDRDEQMIVFYSVTPLGRQGYLLYRLASPVLLSMIFTSFMGLYNGLVHMGLLHLLVSVVLFSLEAPLIALILVNVASNKVEGLAVTKGLGVILAVPFLVDLVRTDWVWLGSVLPTFWASKVFLSGTTLDVSYGALVVGGLLIHFLFMWVLMNRFYRQAN